MTTAQPAKFANAASNARKVLTSKSLVGSSSLVECFDPGLDSCRLSPQCALKGALGRAMASFFAELDGVTLAELVAPVPSGTVSLTRQSRWPTGLPVKGS